VKEVPNLPTYDRQHLWLSLPELLNWNPQRDVAKPYPAKVGTENTAKGGADRTKGPA
jgi:hypothetical protein